MRQNKFSEKELQVREWVKRAEDDELSIKAILKEGGAFSTACFLSQQMAEKYLKAFLIYYKEWYPKIHPLDTLWELCREINKSFDEIKEDSVFLTTFYVATRYPGDYPEFTSQEAQKSFKAAKRIKELVLNKFKNKK